MNNELVCPSCNFAKISKEFIGIYPINKCNNCDLVFILETEVPSKNYSQYFQNQRLLDTKSRSLREKQYEIDLNHLQKDNHGALLDVGCSDGIFLEKISKLEKFEFLQGIDIDNSAIKSVNERCLDKGIKFTNVDLLNFNSDILFHTIVFRGTFQYLGVTLKESILKCKEILHDNGRIYIYSLPHLDSFVFSLLGDKWTMFNPSEHRLFFNSKSINYLCKIYGFQIREISFPYVNTPYEDLKKNYRQIVELISKGLEVSNIPFYGNVMQIILEKL